MAGDTPSTHPPLPPTTEDIRLDWLRLLRSRRVGVTTFYRLLAEHGTAAAALEALPQIARTAGVSNYAACPLHVAEQELRCARKLGARMICIGEADYPKLLQQSQDPPPFFWSLGQHDVLHRQAVALVGARNASSLGTRMTRRLAQELGEAGIIAVSGLARGIDTAAHQGALKTGTIAVLAGGLDRIYPDENTRLAQDIQQSGTLISEQPFGLHPKAHHFPIRNRIVAGLTQAVIVIEGAARSGSLITARAALDQGRDVMSVPGHPFDGRASGCNMLIRDGATLVRSASDVIEALRPLPDPRANALPDPLADAPAPGPCAPETPKLPFGIEIPSDPPRAPQSLTPPLKNPASGFEDTARLHKDILARLSTAPIAEDQLLRDMGISAARFAPALVDLELSGDVSRQPGGLIARLPR